MAKVFQSNVRMTVVLLAISVVVQANCWVIAEGSAACQAANQGNLGESPAQALEVAPSVALASPSAPVNGLSLSDATGESTRDLTIDSAQQVSKGEQFASHDPIILAAVDLPRTGENPDQLQGRIQAPDPTTALDRVDDLTRQILYKEIELERFNLHYKQNVGKQGRWKGWRYAVFQEANFGLNLAGSINNTGERYAHIHDPGKNSTNRLGMGNAVGMIGSIIGATGAALELCINEYHCLEADHKGFSTVAARKHVLDLKAQIDGLMAERKALIQIEQSAPLLQAHAEVDVLEGRVLQDMRDLTLYEYTRFHVAQQRFIAFQQALYFFDLAKYSTGSVGSFFAYMSLHKHRRIWNNRAGVLFDIQGALTVAGPLASRGIGILAAKVHKHLVSQVGRDVQIREIAQLEKDQAALDQYCKDGKCSPESVRAPIARAIVYNLEDQGFQDELHSSLQANRRAKLVATQNVGSGFFVGGTKIASGILYNVVGKQFNTKSARSGLITNSDLFVAGILGTTGSAVAVLDTIRLQAMGELERHKMAKQGKLPGQLLKHRLDQLDQMEQKLKETGKPSGAG
jgi:hypothetical protein